MKLSNMFIVLLILSAFILVGQAMAQEIFFSDSLEDGVSFIYKNITLEQEKFKYTLVETEVCGMHDICTNKTIALKEVETCTPTFECYMVKSYIKESDGFETILLSTKKIGERKDGKNYYGVVHIEGEKISVWDVPIGDRNLREYPSCRAYEQQKGVCRIERI